MQNQRVHFQITTLSPLIDSKILTLADIGDGKCILLNKGRAVSLTFNQKCERHISLGTF
jgi:serine/threonine protein phosphatase PrpC